MISAGIDAGSRFVKVVVWDHARGLVLARKTVPQGLDQAMSAMEAFRTALSEAGVAAADVAGIVATGYGRHNVPFASWVVTEITCHARGVRQLLPRTRTIIEIGGQDSKFIRLDHRGEVIDFAMNDRCAAGTGRFIEQAAARLQLPIDVFGQAALESTAPCQISSMCVVFAETEMIGLLARGAKSADIAAGILNAIAARIHGLTGGQLIPPVAFTGGVAAVQGTAAALARVLKLPVESVPEPFYTGALGAAILAAERMHSGKPHSARVELPLRGDLVDPSN